VCQILKRLRRLCGGACKKLREWGEYNFLWKILEIKTEKFFGGGVGEQNSFSESPFEKS